MELVIVKGEEILTEDLDQDDVFDCFYHLDAVQVVVLDDDNNELFELTEDNATYVDNTTCCVVPEGYYTHAVGWRTISFDIILNDPNHTLTAADFVWSWKTFPVTLSMPSLP